jgi:hypothetical protein
VLRAFAQPAVWRKAFLVGAPVGALQIAVNQGDLWLGYMAGHHTLATAVVVKTFLSPFISVGVAWVAAAAAWTDRSRVEGESRGL